MRSVMERSDNHDQLKQLRTRGIIAHDLGIAIFSGRLLPGETLAGEERACKQLNVSRSCYREAVRILAAKGLIEPKTYVGTRVCPQSNWNMLDAEVLGWTFCNGLNLQLLWGLFELRDMIESSAAGHAAARRTDAEIAAMKTALDAMERYSLRAEKGRRADLDFHAAVISASRNPYLAYLERNIRAAIEAVAASYSPTQRAARDAVPDHLQVFDAIVAGNSAEAQDAMHALICGAQRDLERWCHDR